MPRAVDGTRRHDRRKKILKDAKGYRGGRSKLLRTAKDAVTRAGVYAYRDRRQKKRYFRRLWITRISAVCRSNGITYSRFMNGLSRADITINRKALADMAIQDKEGFKVLIDKASAALSG